MIVVTESEDVFSVNRTVRRVHVGDDEWSTEAIDVLSSNMCMVPVGSSLIDFELVHKRASWLDRALSDHCWTVGIVCPTLTDAVEMDSRTLIAEVVRHSELDSITKIDIKRWAGPRPIDSNVRSSESIWGRRHPINTPGIASRLGSWRSDIWQR